MTDDEILRAAERIKREREERRDLITAQENIEGAVLAFYSIEGYRMRIPHSVEDGLTAVMMQTGREYLTNKLENLNGKTD